jgi:hypothetical protein
MQKDELIIQLLKIGLGLSSQPISYGGA